MPLNDKELIEQFGRKYTNANTIKSKVNDVRQVINHFKPETLTEVINIDVGKLKEFLNEKYQKATTQSSIANSLFTLSSIIKGQDKSQDLYLLASGKWQDKNINQVRGMTKKTLPISVKSFVNKMTSFIKDSNNDAYERFIAGLVYFLPRRMGEEFKNTVLVSNEEFNKLQPTTREGLFNIDTLRFYRHTSKNKQPINVNYNFPEIKKAIQDGALQGRKMVFNQTTPEGINYFVKKLMGKVLGVEIGSQVLRQMYMTRRENDYVNNDEYKADAEQMGHSVEIHATYINRSKLDKMSNTGKELYIESRDLIEDILINLNDNTKVKELRKFTKMLRECHKTIVG